MTANSKSSFMMMRRPTTRSRCRTRACRAIRASASSAEAKTAENTTHETICSMRPMASGLHFSTPMTSSCQTSWRCASPLRSRMTAIWLPMTWVTSRPTGKSSAGFHADFLQATVISRSLVTCLRFSETFSAGGDSQFFGLLRQTAKSVHLPNVLTGLRILRGSLTDKYWFQKRLIEHWHETHKNEPPPGDLSGYLDFYQSLPSPQRMNCLRRWLGQKYGRSAGGSMLDGKPLRAGGYLACSLVLNPGYFIARARRNLST